MICSLTNKPVKHCTMVSRYAYKKGCRCSAAIRANSTYMATWRESHRSECVAYTQKWRKAAKAENDTQMRKQNLK